ncbi:MAG TPA: substrate-binding domain-containing protein [bacterium]|nr:substrate-binding domain-containing protein [bacterium]HQG44792.1 substrate-binding domain-containing protein [bacterium]HQI48505.1 substrate-binding domain-containing protein [bacterium]HQJ63072.1 substrate-binding domain-containing protein [bacterium]
MATIRDIAKLANVSIGTVDRVLHKRGFVSPETQLRIEAAIDQLHYIPNIYARQLKLSRHYQFGILMPELHQDAGYWGQAAAGMQQAGQDLAAYKIQLKYFFFSRLSEDSFRDAFSRLLDDNLDGFMIAPVCLKYCGEMIAHIPPAIPYIFFDSDLPDTRRLTFIGQDPLKSGILAGRLMRMLIGDKAEIAILRVLPEDYHINMRTEGFCCYYTGNRFSNPIHVYDWYETEEVDESAVLVNRILREHPVEGLFVTNAMTYLPARHICEAARGKKIHIIGYDLVEANLAGLNDSVIDFLIDQSPFQQGYQGIQILYRKVVLSADVHDRIMVPINIVVKENAEYFWHAQGSAF